MSRGVIKKNIWFSFVGQLIVIAFGFVVPRIVIRYYGSDTNGLLSTITQICTYLALLEAGISSASRNALLKPYNEKDYDGINVILSASQRYFRKATIAYAICVFVVSAFLPFVLISNVDKETVLFAILLEGLSGVIGFYYYETYSALLSVDGKSYVNNAVYVIVKLLMYTTKVVMAYCGAGLITLQAVTFLIGIVRVLFYRYYIKKTYRWLRLSENGKLDLLADRNAYVITEITGTIFSSTDIVVLSVFVGTTVSSVYAVYNMVFANLGAILSSVYFSLVYILGKAYHKNIREYERLHDAFTSLFVGGITIMMATSYCMCIPFLRLYTSGITDQNYIDSSLPLLFCVVQILSWSRYVSGNLTGVSGHAKSTSYVSIIEAVVNILCSVLLVRRFQIAGVLVGSVIAVSIKVLWCIYVADRKVLNRSYGKTIRILGGNYLLFLIAVLVRRSVSIECSGYVDLFIKSILCLLFFVLLGVVINIATNRDCLRLMRRSVSKNGD